MKSGKYSNSRLDRSVPNIWSIRLRKKCARPTTCRRQEELCEIKDQPQGRKGWLYGSSILRSSPQNDDQEVRKRRTRLGICEMDLHPILLARALFRASRSHKLGLFPGSNLAANAILSKHSAKRHGAGCLPIGYRKPWRMLSYISTLVHRDRKQ